MLKLGPVKAFLGANVIPQGGVAAKGGEGLGGGVGLKLILIIFLFFSYLNIKKAFGTAYTCDTFFKAELVIVSEILCTVT